MPASKTLRGKVIVLLGPPSSLKTETKKGKVNFSSTSGGYSSAGGDSVGGGSGASGSNGGTSATEMINVSNQSGMSGSRTYIEYTITYPGDKLPPVFAKGLTIKLQADPATGEDWAPDRKAEAQLNELFDAVTAARASASTKSSQ